MAERPRSRTSDDGSQAFVHAVGTKARRRLRARRSRYGDLWFGLGMFGVVGWSVAVPSVVLTALGVWLDRRYPSPVSWTLTCLAAGVGLGCLNAWFWIRGERRIIDLESRPDEMEPKSSEQERGTSPR